MTDSLADYLDKQLVRSLVQNAILCPRTGRVLDVRTVKVIRDKDGDPIAVLSPEGLEQLRDDSQALEKLSERGFQIPA